MFVRILLLALVVTLVSPVTAQETTSSQALKKMSSLVGSWEGTSEWSGSRTDKGKMDAEYYVTGNGSAVVENLLVDGRPIMTSVYHLDGPMLRLTHFCGAGNQPRLKAQRIDLAHNEIDFDFVDITNLRSPEAGHVHGLHWRMLDSDHITLTFLFWAGEKHSQELVRLHRTASPGTDSKP